MKKGVLFLLIFAAAVSLYLHGQDEPVTGTVFISSTPINAEVIFDGTPLTKQTPLLLTDVEAGTHQVEVRKRGFATGMETFRLNPEEVLSIAVHLGNEYITLEFPDRGKIVMNGTDVYEEERSFAIGSGSYSIIRDGGYLHVDPVFPDQGFINALHVVLPILLALDGLMTYSDLSYDREASRALSPATVTAYGLTLGTVGLEIGMHYKKKRYMEDRALVPVSSKEAKGGEKEHFLRGEDLLSLGKLREALSHYTWIIQNRRDSEYFPRALYKIGKIHTITEDFVLAAAEFRQIIAEYPLADIYDKTCKSLADLYVRQASFEKALGQIAGMVFYDPLFSKEEIDLYKCEILEAWFFRDDSRLEDLIASYVGMLSRYPNSVNNQYYRYKAAYFLYRAGKPEASRVILDSIESPQEELRDVIGQLRARVGE